MHGAQRENAKMGRISDPDLHFAGSEAQISSSLVPTWGRPHKQKNHETSVLNSSIHLSTKAKAKDLSTSQERWSKQLGSFEPLFTSVPSEIHVNIKQRGLPK